MDTRSKKLQKDTYKKYIHTTQKVLVRFLVIVLFVGFLGLGVVFGYFSYLIKDVKPIPLEEMKQEVQGFETTSYLYFQNDEYIGPLRGDLVRETVTLDQVSPYFTDALLATEDLYFYRHRGIDFSSLMRAGLEMISKSESQTGGSTLTQQLVKNIFLTPEVTLKRKATEIAYALRLENFFTKDEILTAYINVTTYGRSASGKQISGVEAASKGVFGIPAKDLNIAQSAYLVGMLQSPFRYTPFTSKGTLKDPESLKLGFERQKYVLKRLLTTRKITEEEYTEASSFELQKSFAKPVKEPAQQYPFLTAEIERRATLLILDMMAKNIGSTQKELQKEEANYKKYYTKANDSLRTGGYRVYSTVNKELLKEMENTKEKYNLYGSTRYTTKKNSKGEYVQVKQPVEVGAILIENQSGKILALIGGRDFSREQLNHTTQAIRSNGSTMKPLVVYAPAFELGVAQPGSVFADTPITVKASDGNDWSPKNYSGTYNGLVTTRLSIAKSLNIPAVKLYLKIYDKKPTKYLKLMGITTLTPIDEESYSIALGGITNGTTLEEVTNAYTTFANNGKFIDAYLIEKIVNKEGKTIYTHKKEEKKVFSPVANYLTIDTLRDVFKYGTGAQIKSYLNFKSDFAGKTGTTQDFKDSLMIGFNPNITLGVWMGYDSQTFALERWYQGHSYSQRTNIFWARILNNMYKVDGSLIGPTESFKQPSGIVKSEFSRLTGKLPSEYVRDVGLVGTDLFSKKKAPRKEDDCLKPFSYLMIGNHRLPLLGNMFENSGKRMTGYTLTKDFLKLHDVKSKDDFDLLIPDGPEWKNIFYKKIEPMPELEMPEENTEGNENGENQESEEILPDLNE